VAYLLAQAGLTVAWWVGLVSSARFRGWFELESAQPQVLDAFVVADLIVFVGGSVVAGIMIARRSAVASLATAATAGGAAYATLYLAAWVIAGGHGWLGLVPMTAATVITTAIALWVSAER